MSERVLQKRVDDAAGEDGRENISRGLKKLRVPIKELEKTYLLT